ncbi:MAG: ComF family protein [Deltaproteobacteria bacterium]|nr:ComF family protein [Deltaproteobacteria bacterium]
MDRPTIISGFVRLLAPSHCPGCDLPLRPTELYFCNACKPLIEETHKSFRPPAPTAAAFLYGGPLAEAIRRLKYEGRSDYAPALGELLSDAALPFAGLVDLVIPMALHPKRLRIRGFNQALLLAKPVARTLGVKLDVRTLERVRDTPEQAGLSRSDRILNVKGAFRVGTGSRPGRVLLIDDVRTTGATLASAAETLLEAGFNRVYTLALAYAGPLLVEAR